MTVDAARAMLRWSSARVCPRKAIYEAEGAPARDRSDREQRILYRGRSLGRDYGDWLAARDGADAVEREVKVEWELGIGHIDVFHVPTETAIEVLSSAHASAAMVHSKLLQLTGYMEHYPRARAGLLVILDPTDFSEERFPVARDTESYAALVAEVRDRIVQLELWRDHGVIPDRVCRRPAEAIGRFCLHAEHCFDGWEPPLIDRLNDVEALELGSRWLAAKAAERAAGEQVAAAKAERVEVEEQLADRIVEHGKVLVGPYTVTRSDRTRAGNLDVGKAELAGLRIREVAAEFFKPDSHFTVWKVEHSGATPVDADEVDYGEVPF